MGKGEIARYEQFLLFPLCFQKTCTADTQTPGLVWKRVKGKKCWSQKKNAGNQHFLLSSQYFLLYQRQILSFELHFNFCLQINLDKSTFFSCGKGISQ